jgi:hypothetical protein
MENDPEGIEIPVAHDGQRHQKGNWFLKTALSELFDEPTVLENYR